MILFHGDLNKTMRFSQTTAVVVDTLVNVSQSQTENKAVVVDTFVNVSQSSNQYPFLNFCITTSIFSVINL